jgi:hypothetical protein
MRGQCELAFEVIAKDHVHLAIRDEQSGRLTVPGLFAVIPEKRWTGPRIRSGVPVSFPQIGQNLW